MRHIAAKNAGKKNTQEVITGVTYQGLPAGNVAHGMMFQSQLYATSLIQQLQIRGMYESRKDEAE